MTQNGFLNLYSSQITTKKKLPEFSFKPTHNSKNASESWFQSAYDSMILFISSFVWLFWVIRNFKSWVNTIKSTLLLTWYLFGLPIQVLTSHDLIFYFLLNLGPLDSLGPFLNQERYLDPSKCENKGGQTTGEKVTKQAEYLWYGLFGSFDSGAFPGELI